MSSLECVGCRRPKATLQCGVCEDPVCKSCSHFLEEGSFSFLPEVPAELKHTFYCPACTDAHVAPAQERYDALMDQARETMIFFMTQKRALPILKKSIDRVRVDACPDRDETILRLAFLAVEKGFNSVIEVEVDSKKVRNAGYQTSTWRGTGLPADVDLGKVERWVGNKEQLRLGRKVR